MDRMQTIRDDLSATTLVGAIKSNWADYYLALGRSPAAEWVVGPYLTWFLSGVPDSFLNVVLRTQLPSDGACELIEDTMDHFRSGNVTRLSWWPLAGAPGSDLDRHLISHGLIFREGGTGMAADLMALHEDLPAPAGLTIIPVEDKSTLKHWIHVTSIGFGIPETCERRFYELFVDMSLEGPMQSYLAMLNGQPVATSQLFLSAGVAGVYNVTCLPGLRHHGIGTAITLAPLLEARKLNYRISILQASHLGYDMYRRIGFQDFGRLNTYDWENGSKPPCEEGDC
jgi:hypothetical protein